MKIYELKFDENKNKMHRVSVVEDPTVGDGIVFFNNETPDVLFFANDEKQIFYSVVMRPNQLIFRKNIKGENAKVFYTPETVEKMQQAYFKNNGNKETNLNHKDNLTEGIYPFESWIVQNSEVDKSKDLSLSVKNGDWVMAYKVENPELWQDVKSGKIGGLSIESSFMFEEKMSTNTNFIKMNTEKKKSFLEKFSTFFTSEFSEDEKTPEQIAEEEPKKKEAEMAEATPPAPVEEPKESEELMALKAENEGLKTQVADLQERLSKAEGAIVEKDTSITEMSKQVLEFSKQSGEIENPKTYEEMSKAEKLKFNLNKVR